MWKTILAVVGVLLAAIAVWLLVESRPNNLTIEFMNCKVENTQLTIQYGRCMDTLNTLRELKLNQAPVQTDETNQSGDNNIVVDAGPGGMITDPDPGGMVTDADPGGMITDPDPGGMITDPDPGDRPLFAPTEEDLEMCGAKNRSFRESVVKCGRLLDQCANGLDCWNLVDQDIDKANEET